MNLDDRLELLFAKFELDIDKIVNKAVYQTASTYMWYAYFGISHEDLERQKEEAKLYYSDKMRWAYHKNSETINAIKNKNLRRLLEALNNCASPKEEKKLPLAKIPFIGGSIFKEENGKQIVRSI